MTGFPLHESTPVAAVMPPSETELRILRSKVDPDGTLRD
jgi:hypothetical protein